MPTRIRPCRLGSEGEWVALAIYAPEVGPPDDWLSAALGGANLRRMWKVMTSLSQRSEHILLNLEV